MSAERSASGDFFGWPMMIRDYSMSAMVFVLPFCVVPNSSLRGVGIETEELVELTLTGVDFTDHASSAPATTLSFELQDSLIYSGKYIKQFPRAHGKACLLAQRVISLATTSASTR